jgi:hypothetical protein
MLPGIRTEFRRLQVAVMVTPRCWQQPEAGAAFLGTHRGGSAAHRGLRFRRRQGALPMPLVMHRPVQDPGRNTVRRAVGRVERANEMQGLVEHHCW